MSTTIAFNGTEVLLAEERWRHIVMRHPQFDNKIARVTDAASNPDEVYLDPTGAIHALKD